MSKFKVAEITALLRKLKAAGKMKIKVSGKKEDKIKQLVAAVNSGDVDLARIIRAEVVKYKGDKNADLILGKLGQRGKKSASPKKKSTSPKKKRKTPSPKKDDGAGPSNSFTLNGKRFTFTTKGKKTTIKDASGKSINAKSLTEELKAAIAKDCKGRSLSKSVKNNGLRIAAARNVAEGCTDDSLFDGERASSSRKSPSPRRKSPSPRPSLLEGTYGADHCVNTGCDDDKQTCDLDSGSCVDGNYKKYKPGRPTLSKAAQKKLAKQHNVKIDQLKYTTDGSAKYVSHKQEVIDTFRRYLEEKNVVKDKSPVPDRVLYDGDLDEELLVEMRELLDEYERLTGDMELREDIMLNYIHTGRLDKLEEAVGKLRLQVRIARRDFGGQKVDKGKEEGTPSPSPVRPSPRPSLRSPSPVKRELDESDIAAEFRKCLAANMNA